MFDSQAMQLVTTIDVDDRLFGGVVLSPDGQRAYALLWPSSSLAPPAPAYIAYIDKQTRSWIDSCFLICSNCKSLPSPQTGATSTSLPGRKRPRRGFKSPTWRAKPSPASCRLRFPQHSIPPRSR